MSFDVSVIVPSHDRAALIGDTIESILAQTHPAAEIIVVDDGSTDGTPAVVKAFGARVRYHRIEPRGPGAARNAGADLARSPWIAFCDSDDIWFATKLERQQRLHALSPSLDYSMTDFVRGKPGRWETRSAFATVPAGFWSSGRRELEDRLWVWDASLYDRFLRFQPMFPSTVLLSKRRWERLGGFSELPVMGVCEDFEFGLRQAGAPPVGVLAEPLVGIRVHPGNRSSDPVNAWLTQVAILDYVLTAHPDAQAHRVAIEDEIGVKRALAAGRAFALGRLDIVRELSPLIDPGRRDWKLALKMSVARLPMPAAKAVRKALVAANRWRAGVPRPE